MSAKCVIFRVTNVRVTWFQGTYIKKKEREKKVLHVPRYLVYPYIELETPLIFSLLDDLSKNLFSPLQNSIALSWDTLIFRPIIIHK